MNFTNPPSWLRTDLPPICTGRYFIINDKIGQWGTGGRSQTEKSNLAQKIRASDFMIATFFKVHIS